MHQQPPKTPLLRSTTSAKASQVEASRGRTQYAICSVIDSSIEAARLATGPVVTHWVTQRPNDAWLMACCQAAELVGVAGEPRPLRPELAAPLGGLRRPS